MKRIFSIFLCFIFILSVISSPASADSDLFVNLLDYGVATEYGSNSSSFKGTSIPFTYELPDKYTVTYVDVIFSYSNNAQISCYITDSNSSTNRGSLSVNHLGGPFFRAYGTISRRYYDNLTLNFVSDTEVSGKRISVEKFNVSTIDYTSNTVGGKMIGYSMGQYVNSSWSSESQSASISFPIGSSNDTIYNVSYRVDAAYWKKYDFLNFTIALDTLSVDSLSVSGFGGYVVPFEMSYLTDTENMNLKVINISCDLRDLQRTYDLIDYIEVYVTGTTKANTEQHAHIYHAYGVTGFSAPSADLFWYQRLWNSIESGFSSLIGSVSYEFNTLRDQFTSHTNIVVGKFNSLTEEIRSKLTTSNSWLNKIWTALGGGRIDEEFQEDLDEKKDNLDDLSNTLGSVGAPDISDVNLNINGLVNPNVVTLTTSGISTVLSNEIILRVLIISATFAVAGFILFGKK